MRQFVELSELPLSEGCISATADRRWIIVVLLYERGKGK